MHFKEFGDKSRLREKAICFVHLFYFVLRVNVDVCKHAVHLYQVFVVWIYDLGDGFKFVALLLNIGFERQAREA